jgi:hypothetical protein
MCPSFKAVLEDAKITLADIVLESHPVPKGKAAAPSAGGPREMILVTAVVSLRVELWTELKGKARANFVRGDRLRG